MSGWDAQGYDRSFSFVTAYGAGLLELLAAQPGERILDVGCGTGHQAAELAALGAHVVGIDADAAMLDVARDEHPEVAFHRVDAQDRDAVSAVVDARDRDAVRAVVDAQDRDAVRAVVDAQDRDAVHAVVEPPGFDAVLSNAALHWMPRQDDVIAALGDALRPGGRLVVEMGGDGNVARAQEAIRAARRAVGLDGDLPSSWTFPTPGAQAARLERHGFRVRLVTLYDRPTPLSPGDTAADWARMFGAVLVDDVPHSSRAAFDHAVDTHASALGLDRRPDGEPGWWIDYVRLRFVAERL